MERTKHNSSPQVLKDSFDKEICGYLSEQVGVIVNYELFQGLLAFFLWVTKRSMSFINL